MLDPTHRPDLRPVARQFQMYGEFLDAQPCGTGHINDTYCARYDQSGTLVRYILQRINHGVFKNPVALMENIQRVTAHLGAKLSTERDWSRRVLTLVAAQDGCPWHRDDQGNYWRAYLFVEKARTYDIVQSARQAFEAARAFGRFQQLLADLPPPRLHQTIPDFHHTPRRFEQFLRALHADRIDRAQLAKREIDFALHRQAMTGLLLAAQLPERVTRNDTKLNNVLIDDATGEGICVIDLDTVMPGLSLYDFGDMVRTSTCTAKEDERDLSKVQMLFFMFEALVRGYPSSTAGFLTVPERELLAFAGKLITFEIGLRFLTDFLEGDTYFKIHREHHNLDRCRTQFQLVRSMEEQEEPMNQFVQREATLGKGEDPLSVSSSIQAKSTWRSATRGLVQAFTLIELLVVVAVISILAALLLPTLSRAKTSARLTKCISNERQIGLALALYVSDEGAYPYLGLWGFNPPTRSFWAKLLQPYTTSDWTNGIFRCPSFRGLTSDPSAQAGNDTWPNPSGSYAYNGFGVAMVGSSTLLGLGDFYLPDSPGWVKRQVRRTQVREPSDMIAVADSANSLYYLPPPSNIVRHQLQTTMAHYPSVNVAFCDGHVAHLKLSDYLSNSDASRRRWNSDHEPHPEMESW